METFLEIFTKLPIQFIDWSQSFLLAMPPLGIFLFIFALLWLENIFAVIPSDSIILFSGSLVAFDIIGFFPLVLVCTAGSIVGFASMYIIGKKVDEGLIGSGKLKWIKKERIEKSQIWFNRYGYFLIVLSRFVALMRAPITFFAGLSGINFKISLIIASISALIWYSIWVFVGYIFADNLDHIKVIIKSYGAILFPIILLIFVYFILIKKKS